MEEDWQRYRKQGEQATAAGQFVESESMWTMAALIAEEFGEKDPRLCYCLDSLSHALLRQGKFRLAELFLSRSWRIKSKVLGSSQLELARTLNMVAEVFFHQKRFEEAETICRRVLDVYKVSYGEQHPSTKIAADNLVLLEKRNKELAQNAIAARDSTGEHSQVTNTEQTSPPAAAAQETAAQTAPAAAPAEAQPAPSALEIAAKSAANALRASDEPATAPSQAPAASVGADAKLVNSLLSGALKPAGTQKDAPPIGEETGKMRVVPGDLSWPQPAPTARSAAPEPAPQAPSAPPLVAPPTVSPVTPAAEGGPVGAKPTTGFETIRQGLQAISPSGSTGSHPRVPATPPQAPPTQPGNTGSNPRVPPTPPQGLAGQLGNTGTNPRVPPTPPQGLAGQLGNTGTSPRVPPAQQQIPAPQLEHTGSNPGVPAPSPQAPPAQVGNTGAHPRVPLPPQQAPATQLENTGSNPGVHATPSPAPLQNTGSNPGVPPTPAAPQGHPAAIPQPAAPNPVTASGVSQLPVIPGPGAQAQAPAGTHPPQAAPEPPKTAAASFMNLPLVGASSTALPKVPEGTQAASTSADLKPVPTLPTGAAKPTKPPKKLSADKPKCEVCGYELDGEYCQRCTGTGMRPLRPDERLGGFF